MKELSLSILDIVQNSVKAGASNIDILLDENDDTLLITITDDGCGMTPEILARVRSPFTTSRTTRKVGLGIPFFEEAAELTGGNLQISSRDEKSFPDSHGTQISALFYKKHIDFTPLGDIVSTLAVLVQGAGNIDYTYEHRYNGKSSRLSTAELKQILGDIPLSGFEVLEWIKGYVSEQEALLK